jgi:hypothetical protein
MTAEKPLRELNEMEVKSMTRDQSRWKLKWFASRGELVALQRLNQDRSSSEGIKELKQENRILKEKIEGLTTNMEAQDRNIDNVRNDTKSFNLIFRSIHSDVKCREAIQH